MSTYLEQLTFSETFSETYKPANIQAEKQKDVLTDRCTSGLTSRHTGTGKPKNENETLCAVFIKVNNK